MKSKLQLKHLRFPLGTLFGTILALLLFSTIAATNSQTLSLQPVTVPIPIPMPIVNPDFEDGFHQPTGEGELTVGVGWYPGYDDSLRRPEWIAHRTEELGPDSPAGVWSQKMFVTHGTMDGWIRQDISTIPDEWYKVTAWLYMKSQDNQGDVSGFLCINPWGNWNANDRTTICGKEVVGVYDQWVQVDVVAQSFGDRISVFLRGVAKWPVKWNDVYWDTVRMEYMSGGVCPTSTAVVACPTCVPGGSECASREDVKELIDNRLPVVWTPSP